MLWSGGHESDVRIRSSKTSRSLRVPVTLGIDTQPRSRDQGSWTGQRTHKRILHSLHIEPLGTGKSNPINPVFTKRL